MLSLFMYLLVCQAFQGKRNYKELITLLLKILVDLYVYWAYSTELSMLMIDNIYQNGNVFLSTVRVTDGWMRDGLAAF